MSFADAAGIVSIAADKVASVNSLGGAKTTPVPAVVIEALVPAVKSVALA